MSFTPLEYSRTECEDDDRPVPKLGEQLNIDLDAFGGLVSLETANANFNLEYAARAQLDLSIPLKLAFELPDIKVLDTSKIEVEAAVSASNLDLTANIGPLELKLGTAVEIVSGKHTSSTASEDELTDTGGVDFTNLNAAQAKVPAGAILRNKTDSDSSGQDVECVIAAVTATTLTCVDPLPDGNKWDQDDDYEVKGAGVAKLGAKLDVKHLGTNSVVDSETISVSDFLNPANLTVNFTGVKKNCGGKIDPYPPGGGDEVDLNGSACARLSISSTIVGGYVGDITFLAPDVTDPSTWEFGAPDMADIIANFELDWLLIIQIMPELLDKLADGLNGSASDLSVPLIGDALDAGADIVDTINTKIATPLKDIAAELEAAADVGQVKSEARTFIFDLVNDAGLLQDTNGDNGGSPVSASDVIITVKCGSPPGPCADGDSVLDISDFRVTFLIGQGPVSVASDPGCTDTGDIDCQLGVELPIDLGLPGLPLRLRGTVKAGVG